MWGCDSEGWLDFYISFPISCPWLKFAHPLGQFVVTGSSCFISLFHHYKGGILCSGNCKLWSLFNTADLTKVNPASEMLTGVLKKSSILLTKLLDMHLESTKYIIFNNFPPKPCLEDLQHTHVHFYLEVSPTWLNGAYSQASAYRIHVISAWRKGVFWTLDFLYELIKKRSHLPVKVKWSIRINCKGRGN